MTISIDTEKAVDRIKGIFILKFPPWHMRWRIAHITKAVQQKVQHAVMETESFLSSGTVMHAHLPLYTTLFNIALEVLTRAIRQENKKHSGWKEVKVVLVADDMVP